MCAKHGKGKAGGGGSKRQERTDTGSKPKKEQARAANGKRGGKKYGGGSSGHWGGDGLYGQLQQAGLRVRAVGADGNCLFRSLSDQLEGHEGLHADLRQRVLAFIREEREQFEPFIEDDEPFDKYCSRMEEDGTWAGHLELQAASLLVGANITIHQGGMPPWVLHNHKDPVARMLHIAYHGGEHYNSIRTAGDPGSGPPEPIQLGAVSAGASSRAGAGEGDDNFSDRQYDWVSEGTGCYDRGRVGAALRECSGDIDQAIELLVERLADEQVREAEAAAAAAAVAASAAQSGWCNRQQQHVLASGSDRDEQQQALAVGSDKGEQQQQQQRRKTDRAISGEQEPPPQSSGGRQRLPAAGKEEGRELRCPGADGSGGSGHVVSAQASSSSGAEVDDADEAAGELHRKLALGHPEEQQEQQQRPPAALAAGPAATPGVAAMPGAAVLPAAAGGSSTPDDGCGGTIPSSKMSGGGPDIAGGVKTAAGVDPAASGAKAAMRTQAWVDGERAPKAPARNKRCPCGSGKKYKGCCGAAAAAAQRRGAAAGVAAVSQEAVPQGAPVLFI